MVAFSQSDGIGTWLIEIAIYGYTGFGNLSRAICVSIYPVTSDGANEISGSWAYDERPSVRRSVKSYMTRNTPLVRKLGNFCFILFVYWLFWFFIISDLRIFFTAVRQDTQSFFSIIQSVISFLHIECYVQVPQVAHNNSANITLSCLFCNYLTKSLQGYSLSKQQQVYSASARSYRI